MQEAKAVAPVEAVPERSGLTWRQSMLGWTAVGSVWLCAFFGLIAIKPPAFPAMILPAIASGAVAAGIAVIAARRAWLSRWLRSCGMPAAVATAIALMVGARFFFYAFGGAAAILAVLVLCPTVLGLSVVALIRMRRGARVGLVALALAAVFVGVVVSGEPSLVASVRWRVAVFGTGDYEQRSREVLADPPSPSNWHKVGEPYVVTDDEGHRGVVWLLVDGFVTNVGQGLVYEPTGAIDRGERLYPLAQDGSADQNQSTFTAYPYDCHHLDGPWQWCNFG